VRADVLLSLEVGNRSGHFEDAVVGSGAQPQALHCLFKELLPCRIEGAVLFDLPRLHERVGIEAVMGKNAPSPD
jgi:hypothetical protein